MQVMMMVKVGTNRSSMRRISRITSCGDGWPWLSDMMRIKHLYLRQFQGFVIYPLCPSQLTFARRLTPSRNKRCYGHLPRQHACACAGEAGLGRLQQVLYRLGRGFLPRETD